MKHFYFIPIALFFIQCSENPTPKPNAFLKLDYSKTSYSTSDKSPFFNFDISNKALHQLKNKHWSNLFYPTLKADINITHHSVNNNLTTLIQDAEKLTYKHTLKADHIEVIPFSHPEKKIYARLFEITGDAASPIQFQVTDSTKHLLSGSLYFRTQPNYDSILPAISVVKKDIKKLIESIEWK